MGIRSSSASNWALCGSHASHDSHIVKSEQTLNPKTVCVCVLRSDQRVTFALAQLGTDVHELVIIGIRIQKQL